MNTNKRLNEIYNTWYLILQTHLLDGHQTSKNVETIDQRGVRLFYCKSGLGLLDLEEIIAPREEIKSFIKKVNNPESKNYFPESERDFEKIFPDEKKFWNTANKRNLSKVLEKNKKKGRIIRKKKKKNLTEENEKKSVLANVHTLRQI